MGGSVCTSGGEAEEGNILITAKGERGRKAAEKRGKNINMRNGHVSVAEEGKSPHRALFK